MSMEEWLSMAIEWDNVIFTMRDEKFEKEFKKKYFIFW